MIGSSAREGGLVTLFSGLSGEEAAAVGSRLELWSVPFELRNGGQTVMVPADRCAELTVEFARIAANEGDEETALLRRLLGGPSALRGARGPLDRSQYHDMAQERGS